MFGGVNPGLGGFDDLQLPGDDAHVFVGHRSGHGIGHARPKLAGSDHVPVPVGNQYIRQLFRVAITAIGVHVNIKVAVIPGLGRGHVRLVLDGEGVGQCFYGKGRAGGAGVFRGVHGRTVCMGGKDDFRLGEVQVLGQRGAVNIGSAFREGICIASYRIQKAVKL